MLSGEGATIGRPSLALFCRHPESWDSHGNWMTLPNPKSLQLSKLSPTTLPSKTKPFGLQYEVSGLK